MWNSSGFLRQSEQAQVVTIFHAPTTRGALLPQAQGGSPFVATGMYK